MSAYKRKIYQIAESNRSRLFCRNWNALEEVQMLKSLLQLQKNTDDDVLTAALAAPEVEPDEEKEQSVEDSEDKEGAVEKDMTEMLQNIDDAGEHANDATPQVSKEPKDARWAHQHNHRSVARDSLSLEVEAIEHLDNATATLGVRYNGARGDLALKDNKGQVLC